jgi:hypothetical protein
MTQGNGQRLASLLFATKHVVIQELSRRAAEDERWLGKGSSVPGTLQPDGDTAIRLSPKAFVLFARDGRYELPSR